MKYRNRRVDNIETTNDDDYAKEPSFSVESENETNPVDDTLSRLVSLNEKQSKFGHSMNQNTIHAEPTVNMRSNIQTHPLNKIDSVINNDNVEIPSNVPGDLESSTFTPQEMSSVGEDMTQQPRQPQYQVVASSRELEVISDTMREGFANFAIPGAFVAVAGTFFMRQRYRQMKSTTLEYFLLSGLHYFGATTLGMSVALSFFGPTFNQRILERIPHSDLARQIRMEEARK